MKRGVATIVLLVGGIVACRPEPPAPPPAEEQPEAPPPAPPQTQRLRVSAAEMPVHWAQSAAGGAVIELELDGPQAERFAALVRSQGGTARFRLEKDDPAIPRSYAIGHTYLVVTAAGMIPTTVSAIIPFVGGSSGFAAQVVTEVGTPVLGLAIDSNYVVSQSAKLSAPPVGSLSQAFGKTASVIEKRARAAIIETLGYRPRERYKPRAARPRMAAPYVALLPIEVPLEGGALQETEQQPVLIGLLAGKNDGSVQVIDSLRTLRNGRMRIHAVVDLDGDRIDEILYVFDSTQAGATMILRWAGDRYVTNELQGWME